jgi:hypothetical protein
MRRGFSDPVIVTLSDDSYIKFSSINQMVFDGCILSMKFVHSLKSSSMVSILLNCIFSSSTSLSHIRVMISSFKLCSIYYTNSSVNPISLTSYISFISRIHALTSLITSIDFRLIFLLFYASSIIVCIGGSFSKFSRGFIMNCSGRLFDSLHDILHTLLTPSWVFLILFIIAIPILTNLWSLILRFFLI